MDERDFEQYYAHIKCQENKDDPFSVAEVQRRYIALNFFGSIQLRQENDLTNHLLKKDLQFYSKTVDDRRSGCVNNYSESILACLPPNQYDNCRSWKTKLDTIKLEDILKPPQCSANKGLCSNDGITENQIRRLRKAINQSEINNKTHFEPAFNWPEPKPKKRHIEPVFDIPVKQSETNFNLDVEVDIGKGRDDLKYRGTWTAREEPYSQNLPHQTPRRPEYEAPTKQTESKWESMEVDNDKRNDDPKWKGISFRTAREELHLQNQKKNKINQSSANQEGTHSSAPVKKTLGTRKGGVFSKFQPPTRPKEPQVEQVKETEIKEEEFDERLKNIDPKMVELIKSEIMDCGTTITWDDIAGLELAKNTIQEIVVWPMLRPDIFTGLRRPPKGILLFGPPGTGKTLIGKCIASQSCSTFFSISASSLTSKWIGDGEKMVRALFAVARCHQPAVVFIDEIDSLLSQRSDTEHESSRRLKTEFLVQLDGAGTAEDDRILIIGATNRPQELDEAARRRLVKRLYIPLPDEKAREQIIRNLISKERHCLSEAEINEISVLCKGYSGADMKNLCQEASLGPIRSIPPLEIRRINPNDVRPLNVSDFKSALTRIKSSVSEGDLDIYIKWDKQYGCGSGTF
ncbi:UNVERIFIED_CONTAM: hypothetical protein PYX00_001041 [Menopon gallinae]|uniref:Fidgetin-like protein 1 n=1 Tax=Menopon gallinae TaxID=328185 RepID=A0AAW2IBE2_9NEOP